MWRSETSYRGCASREIDNVFRIFDVIICFMWIYSCDSNIHGKRNPLNASLLKVFKEGKKRAEGDISLLGNVNCVTV